MNGLSHNQVTEVYDIVLGSGTLVTGGTIANPWPSSPEGGTVKVLVRAGLQEQPAFLYSLL